jgi:hypothetical protein
MLNASSKSVAAGDDVDCGRRHKPQLSASPARSRKNKSPFRRAAETNTRAACAPQNFPLSRLRQAPASQGQLPNFFASEADATVPSLPVE